MGTFHHDKGELHGITVVVDTNGPRVFVGRCDTVTPEGVVLLDGDVHEETPEGPTKAAWVDKAAAVGVWKSLFEMAVGSVAGVPGSDCGSRVARPGTVAGGGSSESVDRNSAGPNTA